MDGDGGGERRLHEGREEKWNADCSTKVVKMNWQLQALHQVYSV